MTAPSATSSLGGFGDLLALSSEDTRAPALASASASVLQPMPLNPASTATSTTFFSIF